MGERSDRFGRKDRDDLIWRRNPARAKPKIVRLPEGGPISPGAPRDRPDTPANAPGSGSGVDVQE